MKQWNLGNTTVRNPERIRAGLAVLAEHFVGRKFTLDVQEEFYGRLREKGVLSGDPARQSSTGQSARKWAAAFNQLGLARCWQKEPAIEIMAPGRALLEDETNGEDVFLRQLLKLQIPSPLERGKTGDACVHPVFVALKAALELHQNGQTGLLKEEIALYLQTALCDSDTDEAVTRILAYRAGRSAIEGRVGKRRHYIQALRERVQEVFADEFKERFARLDKLLLGCSADTAFLSSDQAQELLESITTTGKGSLVQSAVNARRSLVEGVHDGLGREALAQIVVGHLADLKAHTLEDYSDTTVRYLRATGIFTVAGDKLVIREDRLAFAQAVVQAGPVPQLSEKDYLELFYDVSLPQLPTDDTAFLEDDIARLQERAEALGLTPGVWTGTGELPGLKRQRQQLEEEIASRKEHFFYLSQSRPEQVNDIRHTFEQIANKEIIGGSDYWPAWAEWAVWRVFLAINSIAGSISQTRNFRIDSDLHPIHHAKAGFEDMAFRYDKNCIIPVEVTLNCGERQYAAEREPVMTHVLKIQEANPDQSVIGVFTAPQIHPRTAHAFLRCEEWSEKLGRVVRLDIVPLTFGQLQSLMPHQGNACRDSDELYHQLRELVTLKECSENGNKWLEHISRHLSVEGMGADDRARQMSTVSG